MDFFLKTESPIGELLLQSDGEFLTGIWMDGELPPDAVYRETKILKQTQSYLEGYFRGEHPEIRIPMAPKGTAFQQAVWKILRTIDYGQTLTYGEIAAEIVRQRGGGKMSAQAVGQAVGSNPISILIPCHRVMGAGGKLTGYAGGLWRKKWLLEHEQALK